MFDVGANDGRYTRVFLAPGANVVAIEPNPKLATHLAGRWPAATTERCAVGAEPGDAILYLSDIPIFWTLSSEWMALAKDRGLHNTWNGTAVTVAVTTLDRLGKHGNPTTSRSTSKATNVSLTGLTTAVGCLSLEVQLQALELAWPCAAVPGSGRGRARTGGAGPRCRSARGVAGPERRPGRMFA